jgi:exosortase family protein XrtF
MSIKEFKPTILFLLKFVGIYIVGNLVYGFFVTAYEPRPDPVTHIVAFQTGLVLQSCGFPVGVTDGNAKPTTDITYLGSTRLAVYEGCNGINVMIIFVAFLIAFGPISKPLWWFIPLGIAVVHAANLARISLLFLVAEYMPKAMYFTHKYFFTAILYVVIFLMWVWWVRRSTRLKTSHEAA